MKKSRFFKESKLRKYKDKASDLVEKGKFEKALSIYRDILEAFPDDTTIMLKVGDLCKKLEMLPEAVAVYSTAAEHHARGGRLLQAIAVCRLILEIDPTHGATQKKLASWYAQKYGSSEHSGLLDISSSKKPESHSADRPLAPDNESAEEGDGYFDSESADVEDAALAVTDEEFGQIDDDEIEEISDETIVSEDTEFAAEQNDFDMDRTAPLKLDFTAIFENDEEPSAIYDESDMAEYLAELKAAGLSDEDDFDSGSGEDTRPNHRNLVLKITRPPTAAETLPPMPLFSSLDEMALIDLINELPLRHFDALETIVQEGEHGDSFFIIVSGSVEVFKNGESLATLDEGAFFGEMAMLFPGPRQATVVCAEPCDLFEVSNAQLDSLKHRHPKVGQVLLEFAEQRLLDNLLNTSAIFAPFSIEDRQSLMDKFEPYLVEAGQVIIEENVKANGLYLLVVGRVSVVVTGADGMPVEVSILKGNDIFGEVSLLTRGGAIATVTALEQCRVLMLPRARFDELIMTHPQVLELVATISDERIAAMNEIKKKTAAGRGTAQL